LKQNGLTYFKVQPPQGKAAAPKETKEVTLDDFEGFDALDMPDIDEESD
jgi:hypothetical protein